MKKIALLLLIAFPFIATAQTWDDTVRSIEKICERYKPSNPGAQLAISRNGKLLFSKAWGLADLEHNVPLTTISVTEAGSVSKQFTAAAILLLEQQGKLSLSDNVRKYIPELKDYGTPITLRHMMQHTSGLRDWGSVAALAGWPRSTKTYNNNDALHIISLQQNLNHVPGAEFLYSNSNYNLFAIIVERVSGMTLAAFTSKYIFEPAGMTHTEWRDDFRKVVPNRAIAYSKAGNAYLTNMPNEYVYGNGGLLTTAEDLVKWTEYYTSGKLGNPSLLSKQIATTPLNNGSEHVYAAGLFITKINGVNVYAHDGATAGYRANLEYYPSLGLTISWLSNTSEFTGPGFAAALRNLFIPPQQTNNNNNTPAYNVDASTLTSYGGWYLHPRTGGGIRLVMRDGKLTMGQVGVLNPVADHVFTANGARIEMRGDPRKNGFLFIGSDKDSMMFMPMNEAKTDTNDLKKYTGKYYSAEAEATYTVMMKNSKLVLHMEPATDIELQPTYENGFDSGIGNVYFLRDKADRWVQFRISNGRARNVQFTRVQ